MSNCESSLQEAVGKLLDTIFSLTLIAVNVDPQRRHFSVFLQQFDDAEPLFEHSLYESTKAGRTDNLPQECRHDRGPT